MATRPGTSEWKGADTGRTRGKDRRREAPLRPRPDAWRGCHGSSRHRQHERRALAVDQTCLKVSSGLVSSLKSGLKAKARGRLGTPRVVKSRGQLSTSPPEASRRASTSSRPRCADSASQPGRRTRRRTGPAVASSSGSDRSHGGSGCGNRPSAKLSSSVGAEREHARLHRVPALRPVTLLRRSAARQTRAGALSCFRATRAGASNSEHPEGSPKWQSRYPWEATFRQAPTVAPIAVTNSASSPCNRFHHARTAKARIAGRRSREATAPETRTRTKSGKARNHSSAKVPGREQRNPSSAPSPAIVEGHKPRPCPRCRGPSRAARRRRTAGVPRVRLFLTWPAFRTGRIRPPRDKLVPGRDGGAPPGGNARSRNLLHRLVRRSQARPEGGFDPLDKAAMLGEREHEGGAVLEKDVDPYARVGAGDSRHVSE